MAKPSSSSILSPSQRCTRLYGDQDVGGGGRIGAPVDQSLVAPALVQYCMVAPRSNLVNAGVTAGHYHVWIPGWRYQRG